MERINICMSEDDLDLFERKRSELGMSKSSFVRLLIAEHDKNVPSVIKYKEIISGLSDINTVLNEILINERFDAFTKIQLDEMIKDFLMKVNEKLV